MSWSSTRPPKLAIVLNTLIALTPLTLLAPATRNCAPGLTINGPVPSGLPELDVDSICNTPANT